MQITDTFRVSSPIGQTWATLLDIERIAPALPGAQLTEVDGDEYRGVVKIKVGPITAQYKGVATLAEVDEDAHTLRIEATGRDSRGQGNAKAIISVTMIEVADGTEVAIDTDLQITGKVAQFARGGVLTEVSAKLLGQFAENLERDILATAPPAAPTSPAEAAPPTDGGPRRIESAEPEPVDLLDVAGAPMAKRLVPAAIAVAVLLVLWRLLRRRSD